MPFHIEEYFLSTCFFMNLMNVLELTASKIRIIMPKVIKGIPINKKLNCFKINIAPIKPRITFTNKLIILSKNTVIVD